MSTATKRQRSYPAPIDMKVGCKVSWYFYKDEATARKCAAIAEHNAQLDLAEGFDFGYQVPGNIDHNPTEGLYRVCIP